MTHREALTALSLISLLVACDAGEMTAGDELHGRADDPDTLDAGILDEVAEPFRWVDRRANRLREKLECASGNAVHQIGVYTPGMTPSSSVFAYMKQEDDARQCPHPFRPETELDQRIYSTSRADAIDTLRTYLASPDELLGFLFDVCEEDLELTPGSMAKELFDFLEEEDTRAVFSSAFHPSLEDTSCWFVDAVVLRRSGTALRFSFDGTD